MALRCDLVYGPSSAGKTTWWLQLAERLFKEGRGKTRVYHAGGGAETIIDSGLVDTGIVEICQFDIFAHPFETLQLCARGFWPDTAGKLIPTTATDLAKFAMFVFEGLSLGADYLMGETEGGLAYRSARGEKLGQDSPIMLTDGSVKVGGNPPSHYNIAQLQMAHVIKMARALPGWVQWTAHERLGEDKDTGLKIVGPDICGKAMTAKIGALFGNTTHLCLAHKKVQISDPLQGKVDSVQQQHRAYTRIHMDPDGASFVKYFANTRVALLPNAAGVLVNPMPEFIEPADAVKFYQLIEKAKIAKVAA